MSSQPRKKRKATSVSPSTSTGKRNKTEPDNKDINSMSNTDLTEQLKPAMQPALNNLQQSIQNDIAAAHAKLKDELKSELEGRFDKIEERVSAMEAIVGIDANSVPEVNNKLKQLEDEIEFLHQNRIERNLVITGVKEADNENLKQLIEKLVLDMGLPNMLTEFISRMGKKRTSSNRPIILKTTSIADKISILRSKKVLNQKPEWKGVYINPHLTSKASEEEKLLRDTAKIWKQGNPGIQYSIRNGRLRASCGGKDKYYFVNREAKVEEEGSF